MALVTRDPVAVSTKGTARSRAFCGRRSDGRPRGHADPGDRVPPSRSRGDAVAGEVVRLRRPHRTPLRGRMRGLVGWLTMPALLVATAAVLVLAVQPRTLVS